MTHRIGLVIRSGNQKVVELAEKLVQWAGARKHEILLDHHSAVSLNSKSEGLSNKEIVEQADPIVTLGGDGTLIGAARFVQGTSPLFVGVNFGNL